MLKIKAIEIVQVLFHLARKHKGMKPVQFVRKHVGTQLTKSLAIRQSLPVSVLQIIAGNTLYGRNRIPIRCQNAFVMLQRILSFFLGNGSQHKVALF